MAMWLKLLLFLYGIGSIGVVCSVVKGKEEGSSRLLLEQKQKKEYFPSSYPEYCSKNVKGSRKIASLSENDRDKVGELLQVQTIIRHGARTPWTASQCWLDYNVTWNHCNVTELMITSPTASSEVFFASDSNSNSNSNGSSSNNFVFRKLYDGFREMLGGDCLTGQLLSEGFDQERDLGRVLADAYLDNSNSYSLNLFDKTVAWSDIDRRQIYLRSDDEARTLMSGQIVFSSMFEHSGSGGSGGKGTATAPSIVDWHTGDYAIDQIHPNKLSCPRLKELSSKSFESKPWISYNTSKEAKKLNDELDVVFGKGSWSWSTVMDCLYTTVCSGKSVSYSYSVSGSSSGSSASSGATPEFDDDMLSRVVEQVEMEYFYNTYFNGAMYARVAMSTLAAKIKSYVERAISASSDSSSSGNPPPIKFALWAGHDTTIMPLLAAIYPQEVAKDDDINSLDLNKIRDKTWPGYASFISIEVYRLKLAGKFAFRIVYNGQPLRLPGCPALSSSSLCDIDQLMHAFAFSSDSSYSCGGSKDTRAPPSDDDVVAHQSNTGAAGCPTLPIERGDDIRSMNTTSVLVALVLSIFIGSLIGATFVVYSYKNMVSKGYIAIDSGGNHVSNDNNNNNNDNIEMADM